MDHERRTSRSGTFENRVRFTDVVVRAAQKLCGVMPTIIDSPQLTGRRMEGRGCGYAILSGVMHDGKMSKSEVPTNKVFY